MKWVSFFLSLGSNIGERERHLQKALQRLGEHKELKWTNVSSLYETDPVGYTDQPPFLNIVVQGETILSPEQLLHATQEVETSLGRTRSIHWGPRTIDIDILLYNNKRFEVEHLVIPHPRMKERAFVLIPLAEIAPNVVLPGESKSVHEMTDSMGEEGVRKWKIKFRSGEGELGLFENSKDTPKQN